jgi:hypothetical protein
MYYLVVDELIEEGAFDKEAFGSNQYGGVRILQGEFIPVEVSAKIKVKLG